MQNSTSAAAGKNLSQIIKIDEGQIEQHLGEMVRASGVSAVVDYDRLTIEGPGADAYVSFDNVEVGSTMGDVLEPLEGHLVASEVDPLLLFEFVGQVIDDLGIEIFAAQMGIAVGGFNLKDAVTHIQNKAPGPPREMAVATPAILPVPTVADRAVARA